MLCVVFGYKVLMLFWTWE